MIVHQVCCISETEPHCYTIEQRQNKTSYLVHHGVSCWGYHRSDQQSPVSPSILGKNPVSSVHVLPNPMSIFPPKKMLVSVFQAQCGMYFIFQKPTVECPFCKRPSLQLGKLPLPPLLLPLTPRHLYNGQIYFNLYLVTFSL